MTVLSDTRVLGSNSNDAAAASSLGTTARVWEALRVVGGPAQRTPRGAWGVGGEGQGAGRRRARP